MAVLKIIDSGGIHERKFELAGPVVHSETGGGHRFEAADGKVVAFAHAAMSGFVLEHAPAEQMLETVELRLRAFDRHVDVLGAIGERLGELTETVERVLEQTEPKCTPEWGPPMVLAADGFADEYAAKRARRGWLRRHR